LWYFFSQCSPRFALALIEWNFFVQVISVMPMIELWGLHPLRNSKYSTFKLPKWSLYHSIWSFKHFISLSLSLSFFL
jgi:hypothetical protein